MRMLLLVGGIGSFVFAALIYPATGVAVGMAQEVWILKDPATDAAQEINRALFEMDAPAKDHPSYARMVMQIYGSPLGDQQRVFVSSSRVVHPKEMPELSFVIVGEGHGGNPIEILTLYFFARWFYGGAVVVGFILLSIACLLAQRRRKAAALAAQQAAPPTA